MHHALMFLHVISALLLGAFVIVPFITMRLHSLSAPEQTKIADVLLVFVKVGEIALVALLITGGVLISSSNRVPSGLWMALAFILLLIIGAFLGMAHGKLKAISKTDKSNPGNINKLNTYSWLTAIAVILAIFVMTNPQLF